MAMSWEKQDTLSQSQAIKQERCRSTAQWPKGTPSIHILKTLMTESNSSMSTLYNWYSVRPDLHIKQRKVKTITKQPECRRTGMQCRGTEEVLNREHIHELIKRNQQVHGEQIKYTRNCIARTHQGGHVHFRLLQLKPSWLELQTRTDKMNNK